MRELEEGPLIALEINRQGERQGGDGFEAPGVQQLDPHIDVTIGLGPDALFAMNAVALVAVGVQGEDLSSS